MTTVLGVDPCPGGWVGVELRDGRFASAHVGTRLNELIGKVPDAVIIGVDMPLGLLDSGERDADRVVKRKLGQRSSSLFVMPPRPVFDELNHPAASARCKALTGKGLSIQAWGLKAKLLEANALYDNDAPPLREIHPELSFLELGLLHVDGGKKIWRGQRARLPVLEAAGIYLPEDLGQAVARVPADDVLDAAAAAWTAHRIAHDVAECLPDPPQRTDRGQSIAIWY
jgi:predicted RNase H-like nuclease